MSETVDYVTTAQVAKDAGAMLLERRELAARRVQVGQLTASVLPAAPFGALRPQDEPMLRFFGFAHLPAHLQDVSKPFHDLAHTIAAIVPRSAERTVALRKLVESKDAAVRAVVYP